MKAEPDISGFYDKSIVENKYYATKLKAEFCIRIKKGNNAGKLICLEYTTKKKDVGEIFIS